MNIGAITAVMCANMTTQNLMMMQNSMKASKKVEPVSKSTFDKDKEKHRRGENK